MSGANIITDVMTGALGGIAGGPIGMGLGVAGALATDLLPSLGKYLFGPSGASVGAAVASVVQAATGTSDPVAQALAIKDPTVATNLRIQLAQIEAQSEAAARQAQNDALVAQLRDVQSARDQTTGLAKAGSELQWAPAILSAIILLAFGVMLYVVLTSAVPPSGAAMANVLLGTLAAMATQVANFWLGSSSGSNRKTDLLFASTPPSSGQGVVRG
jgi:hypothetical protein